jgi:hypothetical protein
MHSLLRLIIVLFLFFGTGPTFAQKVKKQDQEKKEKKESPYQEVLSKAEDFHLEKPNGSIDWGKQYIEAKGESVIDTVRFKNKAQARAMATRGAVVVAQRNLLEIINGVKVYGETTVENMITTNDYIFTKVEGIIRGAEIIGDPKEEWGMMTVTMRVPLYENNGLAPAVYDAVDSKSAIIDEEEKSKDIKETEEKLAEFIFDLTGMNFDPALFPVIVDENGDVLVDLYKIYDPKQGKFPQILQTTKEMLELTGVKKGVDIIEVIDAYDGKIVVSTKAKKKFNWEKITNTITKIGKILLLFV